jgi:hypothetical protein
MSVVDDFVSVLKGMGYRTHTMRQPVMKDCKDVIIDITDANIEIESVSSYRMRYDIGLLFMCYGSDEYYNLINDIIENVYKNLNDVKFKWKDISTEMNNEGYLVTFIGEYTEVIYVG